ncbi:MAG: flagellar protein FlgN [Cellvibrio sp.]|uniref:flagellar export chaperone FlgN n=1 Tax=Cellvibrio sp. TaxID=1965322 RepID=UPI00319F7355
MSRREQLLDVIEQDIQQDSEDYLVLRKLMQDLYAQLLLRDCQQIDQLNLQINQLIEQLRTRAQRRNKIITAFGIMAGNQAMQTLFSAFPAPRGDRLQKQWAQLTRLVVECKELNERNGKLLSMHNDILSKLLNVGADSPLYTPQFY